MNKQNLLLSLGVLAVGAVIFNEATKKKTTKKGKSHFVVNGTTHYDEKLTPPRQIKEHDSELGKANRLVAEIYEKPNDVLLSALKETLNLAEKNKTKFTRKEFQSDIIQLIIKKIPTAKYSDFLPDIPMTVEDLEKKIHHMDLDERYQAVLKA